MTTEKQLLKDVEVQEIYGIIAKTMRRERLYTNNYEGIPYHKVGRRVFYRISDIEEFLSACKVKNSLPNIKE